MKKQGIVFLAIMLCIIMFFASCDSAPKTCSHKFSEWTVLTEPTCSFQGKKVRICSLCDKKEFERIDLLPHTEIVDKEAKAPTCTLPGTSERISCSVCGLIIKDMEILDATGHDFDIKNAVTATLLTGGLEYRNCKVCGHKEKGQSEKLRPEQIDIPVFYISGDTKGISKTREKSVSVNFKYKTNEINAYALIKWQGNSSAKFDKKNYTVKLFEDEAHTDKKKVDFGWGKENKYCLKANYVDYSQSRNIVSCRIFSDIVATRKNIDPNLKRAPNYGTVDGFPILVYINNQFQGLYTLNIPKDRWLYGMKNDESLRQAVLCADQSSDKTRLKETMTVNDYEWDVEHCSTSDNTWVAESFNNLINFINTKDGEEFRQGIGNYVDVESAIDTLIYTYTLNALDNLAKNINYVTYDGKKWIVTPYDLDATWGMWWDGTKFEEAGSVLPIRKKDGSFSGTRGLNQLYLKLLYYFPDEIKDRYKELRSSVLTYNNIINEFLAFNEAIPKEARESEKVCWQEIPSNDIDHFVQINDFVLRQLSVLDEFMRDTL